MTPEGVEVVVAGNHRVYPAPQSPGTRVWRVDAMAVGWLHNYGKFWETVRVCVHCQWEQLFWLHGAPA